MTCIIGLVEDGKVYLGGDSRVNFGSTVETHPRGKVLRKGDMLISSCGMMLTRNLIEHVFEPPERPNTVTDEGYIVAHVIPVLHDLMKMRDADFSESGALIGYRQQVYKIASDYSVTVNARGLQTGGSGSELALGAMLALAGKAPKERILRALEIAAECNDGCAPPFYIEML